MLLAYCMRLSAQMLLIGTPAIRGKTRDAKWFQQRFQLQKHCFLSHINTFATPSTGNPFRLGLCGIC